MRFFFLLSVCLGLVQPETNDHQHQAMATSSTASKRTNQAEEYIEIHESCQLVVFIRSAVYIDIFEHGIHYRISTAGAGAAADATVATVATVGTV